MVDAIIRTTGEKTFRYDIRRSDRNRGRRRAVRTFIRRFRYFPRKRLRSTGRNAPAKHRRRRRFVRVLQRQLVVSSIFYSAATPPIGCPTRRERDVVVKRFEQCTRSIDARGRVVRPRKPNDHNGDQTVPYATKGLPEPGGLNGRWPLAGRTGVSDEKRLVHSCRLEKNRSFASTVVRFRAPVCL